MSCDPLTLQYTTPLAINSIFVKDKAIRRIKKAEKVFLASLMPFSSWRKGAGSTIMSSQSLQNSCGLPALFPLFVLLTVSLSHYKLLAIEYYLLSFTSAQPTGPDMTRMAI